MVKRLLEAHPSLFIATFALRKSEEEKANKIYVVSIIMENTNDQTLCQLIFLSFKSCNFIAKQPNSICCTCV